MDANASGTAVSSTSGPSIIAIVVSIDDDDDDDEEVGTDDDVMVVEVDKEAVGGWVRGGSVLATAMTKSANSVLATWSWVVPYCTSRRRRRLASNVSWMTVLVGDTGDLASKEMNAGASACWWGGLGVVPFIHETVRLPAVAL